MSSSGSGCTSIREVSERVGIADIPPDCESTQEDTDTIDFNTSNDIMVEVKALHPQ